MEREMADAPAAAAAIPAAAEPLTAVADEGEGEAEAEVGAEEVGSTLTMERVAAAKKFIENHYRSQIKKIQERKESFRRLCLPACLPPSPPPLVKAGEELQENRSEKHRRGEGPREAGKMIDSLLNSKFYNKCKHAIKCTRTRLDLLRQKKQAMVKFLKKDVADLLTNGLESHAFARMEGLIVEMNQASCCDMIEQYCEHIVKLLNHMQKERECPQEALEAVSTLIFAAARFPDLPELCDLRHIFTEKYGSSVEPFVNSQFVQNLQSKSFTNEEMLRVMKCVAEEFSVPFDSRALEWKISCGSQNKHFPSRRMDATWEKGFWKGKEGTWPQELAAKEDIPTLIDTVMKSPVTALLGPMAPLIRKVGSLKFIAPCPSDNDMKRFKEHLEVLCRDLLDPEESSFVPKWWRMEVRELLYDTEDRLDKVILLPDSDFSELIAGVEDAYQRRNRLKLAPNCKTVKSDLGEVHVSCLKPDESTSHKLLMPISASSSCIVGLNELTNKLLIQLSFDDHNQKGLKVVPILGFPGVGKTTAAGILYHKYRGKFQCSAFVRVSRTPDMRSILISILLQIKAPWLSVFPDVHNLIDGIKEHLKGKRYFIILDGLWTASLWDIISRAFPDGNYGSRIVTTTQINDVALACCRYYPDYIEMSPLNDDQSRKLFFTIVFGFEDRCPSDFKQVSEKIIKKCAGLPLAIINVANLLGRGSELSVEKWEDIQDSLPSILRSNNTSIDGKNDFSSDSGVRSDGSQLARGTVIQKWKHTHDSFFSTLEGLKQVLVFIYNNFPPHLKTCLLYLSMYPEGYLVRKHDLVRQWVAEGFMNAMGGRSAEEIAGDYFDDLVRCGIVQPVDTKYGSEVLSCTVHHMVLDLIRHKSSEMNFIITVDHSQSSLALPDQVRRLSIQFGGVKSADIPENIVISKLRSFLFCGFIDCVPSVVDYEFLRVLILDLWTDGDETEFDLTRICELLRLRYLKIQCNLMVYLPDQISRLKYLETLEVDAILSAVPSDIGRLENLLHLLLPRDAILPQGHGSLTSSLLTLGCFDLSKNSSRNVIDLAELTNLQDLRLTCSTSTTLSKHLVDNMKHLALVLGKLRNLRSLALNGTGASSQSICYDGLSSVHPLPAFLEKLELRPRICTLSRLPKWIGELSRLAILKIEVVVLLNVDIAILGGLASLTALSLRVLTANEEWSFKKGFRSLKYLKFVSASPYMSFSGGAMPIVQNLKIAFNANRMGPVYHPWIYGLKNMTGLTEVTVKLGGANADESSKGDAERVLKDAFSNHPSSPILNVQWVDHIF